jgi:hypothetical protein
MRIATADGLVVLHKSIISGGLNKLLLRSPKGSKANTAYDPLSYFTSSITSGP